jgi:hypothetical protein
MEPRRPRHDFGNLPMDVVKYILLFDERFILRKGELVSIIPKTDYRYRMLEFVTIGVPFIEVYGDSTRYSYNLKNRHNYKKRGAFNGDLLQVSYYKDEENWRFSIWIGRQRRKRRKTSKRQIFLLECPKTYQWEYIEYEYVRG